MSITEFKDEFESIKYNCEQSWYSALLSKTPHEYNDIIKSVNFNTFLKISYTLYKVNNLSMLNSYSNSHLKSTLILYPETILLFNMDYNNFIYNDESLEDQLYFAILEFELNRIHLLKDVDISVFTYTINFLKNGSKLISKKELIDRLKEYGVFYSSDLINIERFKIFIKDIKEELKIS